MASEERDIGGHCPLFVRSSQRSNCFLCIAAAQTPVCLYISFRRGWCLNDGYTFVAIKKLYEAAFFRNISFLRTLKAFARRNLSVDVALLKSEPQ